MKLVLTCAAPPGSAPPALTLAAFVELVVRAAFARANPGHGGALKAETRAAIKTLDKYGGDYSRLTDLARM